MNSKNFCKETDVVIVGSGVAGSFWALKLARAGVSATVLEAGKEDPGNAYPTDELAGNGELYWGGGVELNSAADLGLLRPRVVGARP